MDSSINLYDLTCISCGIRSCYACENASHFPAFCSKYKWWNARSCVTNRVVCQRIEHTERKWYELDVLMGEIGTLKTRFQKDYFESRAHLPHMIVEMERVVETLRWIHVVFCINDGFAADMGFEFVVLENSLHNLYIMFPHDIPQCANSNFHRLRITAANSVIKFLNALTKQRSN